MTTPPLIVSVADVAADAGIDTPTAGSREETQIVEAIRAVQSKMDDALGRPVVPTQVTETGRSFAGIAYYPDRAGWDLHNEPVIAVVSNTPETDPLSGQPTGYSTVVYTWGLNGPTIEYLRSFALARVVQHPKLRRLVPPDERLLSNVTTREQSATYEKPLSAADDEPPSYDSLAKSRWSARNRRVYSRPAVCGQPRDHWRKYDDLDDPCW